MDEGEEKSMLNAGKENEVYVWRKRREKTEKILQLRGVREQKETN